MSREAEAAHVGEEHHKSTLDRLIYMANQISWFFNSQPEDKRVPGILDHIQHFWDPRMRKEIFAHIDKTGGERLDANALDALIALKLATEAKLRATSEAAKIETGQQRFGESAADDQQGAQQSPKTAPTLGTEEEPAARQRTSVEP